MVSWQHLAEVKLSVGVTMTGHPEILQTEGQFTQGSSSGRTLGESVSGMFEKTVLIGRTGFDTMLSVPDPTLRLS
jgi:hypothetical protein